MVPSSGARPTRLGLVLLHRDSVGTIVRVRELANSLATHGFEVFVLSPFPVEEMGFRGVQSVRIVSPLGRVIYSAHGSTLKKALLRTASGRLVIRPRLMSRAIMLLSSALARVAKELRLDLLEGEQDLAAAAAIRAGRIAGIPSVVGLHDIWREELLGSRKIDRKTDAFLLDLLKWTIDSADLVTVVSESMKDRLVSHYGGKEFKIQVVPLGCRPKRNSAHYHSAEETPRVIHSGQISFYDNEELLFQTAVHLKKEVAWPFYLAKKGDGVERFERWAAEKQLKLDWYWHDDATRFYNFLQSCRVGVVTSLNHPTRHYGPAMKFYDYLSCGVPVVANRIGGWTEEIEQHGVGTLTDSDPKKMAAAIIELASDKEKAYKASRRALEVAHSIYNMDQIADQVAKRYLRLRNDT